MPRRRPRPLGLEPLEDRLAPAVVRWNVDADGSWHTDANWLDEFNIARVPTGTDQVILDRPAGTFVVTVSSSVTVAGLVANESLRVTGGSFRVNSDFTLNAAWELAGGTLYASSSVLTLAAPGTWTGGELGSDGTISNTSTLTIADGTLKRLQDDLTNTGTVLHTAADDLLIFRCGAVNEAGGVFEFRSDADVLNDDNALPFRNRGTVRKATGTGESDFTDIPFLNEGGTLDVRTGTLRIGESHNNTQEHTGGAFHVEPGATLQLSSQTSSTHPPDFAGTYTGTGGGRVEIGGTVSMTGTATFDFPTGMLHWTAGQITEGTFLNLGELNVSGDGTRTINGAVLENRGLMIQTGTQTWAHSAGGGTDTLRNSGTGTIELRGAMASTSGLVTEYAGLIRKTGTGEVFLDGNATFQGGTFEVQAGFISFAAFVGGNGGATFDIAPAARVDLLGMHQEWTVAGTLRGVGGGRFELYRDLNAIGGQTLTLDFAEGMFHMLDGARLTGTVANAGFLQVGNTAAQQIVSGTLTNDGTIVRTGAGNLSMNSSSAIVNNGLFEVHGDGTFALPTGLAIDNRGTFRRATGGGTFALTGPSNARFSNTGTVEAKSGTLHLASGVTQLTPTPGILGGGAWVVEGGATLTLAGGAVVTNRGDITLNGTASAFTNLSGLTANEGTLRLRGGRDLATPAAFANPGTLDLAAGSTLAPAGAFTTSGTLAVEVGGQVAQVSAGGGSGLGGTLAVRLAPGFAPTAGQRYTVVTSASRAGDFVTLTGLAPHFVPAATATGYDLLAVSSGADLAVTAVTAPSTGTVGEPITISFVVRNLGTGAATGSWRDSVYLSADDQFDPTTDLLVGRVDRVGGLPSLAEYTAQLTAPVPAAATGSYRVLVIADTQLQVPDAGRANNTRSGGPVAVDLTRLTLGTPATGTVVNGETRYFRLDAAAGADVEITATGGPGALGLVVRYGDIPTGWVNDGQSATDLEVQRVTVRSPLAGPYYVRVVGARASSFEVRARTLGFEITRASQTRLGNGGPATIALHGAGFTPATTVTLGTRPAVVRFVSANLLHATFDLRDEFVGSYPLTATDPAGTDTLDTPIEVFEATPSEVEVLVSAPAFARAGVSAITQTASVTYRNPPGHGDAAAPLLFIQAVGVRLVPYGGFVVPGAPTSREVREPLSTIAFLGLGRLDDDHPATVLRSGVTAGVSFRFDLTDLPADVDRIEFVVYEARLDAPIDWADMRSGSQPAGVSAEAWAAVMDQFQARVGATMGDLYRVLLENAAALDALGRRVPLVSDLVRFELLEVDRQTDTTRRFTGGALGYGTPDPTDFLAAADGDDRVFVRVAGQVRYFTKRGASSFVGVPGDDGVVTRHSAGFQLQEADGTRYVFRADGRLDFVENANGTRTTAQYTGTLLTRFADSFGDASTFTYSGGPNPVITSRTDAVGRVTTFEYVSSSRGPLLSKVTTPRGSVSLDWGAAGAERDRHLVRAITGADGVRVLFAYDAAGRMVSRELTGGAERVTFVYGPAGEVTTIAADGSATTVSVIDTGGVGRVVDPMGAVTSVGYDFFGYLARVSAPGRLTSTFQNDARGNTTRATDPRGHSTLFTYSDLNRTTGFTDARGNAVGYGYDAGGDLTATTFPDGTAEQYVRNALGQVTRFTDRAGRATNYTYNSNHLLIRTDYFDGSRTDFTYDARRNMLSASGTVGGVTRTTTFTYDAADRLTRQTDANGRVLEYTYDAFGRRTRMTDTAGYTVNYAYDAAGRLFRLTDGANALLVEYEYDALGRLAREEKGNGEATTFAYDAAGRLLRQTEFHPDGTPREALAYFYDAAGRPIRMVSAAGTTDYAYDPAGQLVRVALPSGRVVEYAYDEVGNRRTVTDGGTTSAYSANNLNQYTAGGAESFTYDANGNLTARTGPGGTTTYVYDAAGRLLRTDAPAEVRTFEYDALGNRTASTWNGVRTEYLIDPFGLTDVVGEFDAGGARGAG